MKFVDQRVDPIIHFSTLSIGELFLSNGEPFLKIKPIENPIHEINAIDLIDGEPYRFGDEEPIEKIWNCELVLKG